MKRIWLREEGIEEDKKEKGISLLEVMVSFLVVSLLVAVSLGAFSRIRERNYADSILRKMEALVAETRALSIIKKTNIGILFESIDGKIFVEIYEDMDWDGVNRKDIEKGIDKMISKKILLNMDNSKIEIPKSVKLDPSNKPITSMDAVKFGKGDILTFSPKGEATPGTLFISEDRRDICWAIRVAGLDGRIRVFKHQNGTWEEKERW